MPTLWNCFRSWSCPNTLYSTATITGLISGAYWQGHPGLIRAGGLALSVGNSVGSDETPTFDDFLAETPVTKSGSFIIDEQITITGGNTGDSPDIGDWRGTFVLAAVSSGRYYLRCIGSEPWNGIIPNNVACAAYTATDSLLCVASGTVYSQATISNDTGGSYVGHFGSNICHGVTLGITTPGNVLFDCDFSGNYKVSIVECIWDGTISMQNLGTYGFNPGTHVNISGAEIGMPIGSNLLDYTVNNGRYLILSQGPWDSILQKISN